MTQAAQRRVGTAVYALLSYVPLLLAGRGEVTADTKAYLYTDPGRLVSRAGWLWDSHVAAGTVTHQNIGYLFPMGPYFWGFDRLGVPDWVAQRIWLGSVLFAAAMGTRWLLRRLGLSELGAFVAGLVYMTSPYILPYFGRSSALLLPWAALPWLTGLFIESLRRGGWRAPALFALVLTFVGGTNASSVIFIAIGPALWLPFALWVYREASPRASLAAIGRLAATSVPLQLWWLAGLRVQGQYGLPILQLTETVETVAKTSSAPEISRGAGYWIAYGGDMLSPWRPAAVGYTQHLWLIVTSFALPALAVVAAICTRWRYRGYFLGLAVMGLVVGVGTYPYDDPPLFGWVLKTAMDRSTAVMALRSSPRAVPLLVLAMAAFLGCGVDALARSRVMATSTLALRRFARPVAAGLAVLTVVNLPPLLNGDIITADNKFPETMPQYWLDATQTLDAHDDGTRVLELPGSDFAAYRWGWTQDPITPGMIDRPWIGRELTAYGTPGTVDLLRALDRRIQEGVFDERSLAPIARLFAAGDLLWRSDSQYERYRTPRPRSSYAAVERAPGLGEPELFGVGVPNVPDPRLPMRDEAELGTPASVPDAPALAIYPVEDARPIVRAQATGNELIVAGDGESLVDAAEAGLLDADPTVLYSASFADNSDAIADAINRGASLLLTDGNRRNAERWGTIKENKGYTEAAGSGPLKDDPKDNRLELFPGADDDTRTVTQYRGVADIAATTYGNTVAYSTESRPSFAIDGDLRTAWRLGGFSDVVGDRLRITLDEPVTTDAISVIQLNGNRFITQLGVRLDGQRVTVAPLSDPSFDDDGQSIPLGGPRTFSVIELEIVDANVKGLPSYLNWSPVGFREIGLMGIQLEEVLRLPTDLLDAAGAQLDNTDLSVLMTRWRADPAEVFRSDPEPRLARTFALPSDRQFSVAAEARIESRAEGSLVDGVLGVPGLAQGHAQAFGTDYLGGSLRSRPTSAIDDDPTTAWSPGLGPQKDRSFHVELPDETQFDHLSLQLLADGWHSVPTQLTFVAADGSETVVDIPPVADSTDRGTVVPVDVSLPSPLTTTAFTVRVSEVREVYTTEYFSGGPLALPVGIAELGIEQVRSGPIPVTVSPQCRDDLLSIDGQPVTARLTGTIADALDRKPLRVEPCTSPEIDLGVGDHLIESSNGIDVGVSLDRVLLESPAPASGSGTAVHDVPNLVARESSPVAYDIDITDATEPFWLVLGQSQSEGWKATIDGNNLGPSTLVDGYANGWLIDPSTVGDSFSVTLEWTPQRSVWIAVAISSVAFVAVCALALWLCWRDRTAVSVPFADTQKPDLDEFWTPVHVQRPPASVLALVALCAGIAGIVFGGLAVGAGVAALVVAASLGRWPRLAAFAAVAAVFPLTTAWYLAKQWRYEYPSGTEWPTMFGWTHSLVLVGLIGLAAISVADAALRHRSSKGSPPEELPAAQESVLSPASDRA